MVSLSHFSEYMLFVIRHIRLFQVMSIRGSSLKRNHIFIVAEELSECCDLMFAEHSEWMDNFRILNSI
jgi:hypothetical protein